MRPVSTYLSNVRGSSFKVGSDFIFRVKCHSMENFLYASSLVSCKTSPSSMVIYLNLP